MYLRADSNRAHWEAMQAFAAAEISQQELEALREEAVRDTIQRLEATGSPRPYGTAVSLCGMRSSDEGPATLSSILVRGPLEYVGHFVISDFPFPETDQVLRTAPGRIMAGIQVFEAQIDDQLLPMSTYFDLLVRRGFRNVGSFELTRVHAVTYGQR